MFRLGSSVLDLLGISLMAGGFLLGCLPLIRPALFKRQDALVAIVFLGCGVILWRRSNYLDGVMQLNLLLMSATAAFYTADSLRLRAKHLKKSINQNQ